MLSNNSIKLIASLKQKKYREQHGLFVAEGVKITNELLESDIKIKTLIGTPAWFSQQKITNRQIECHEVNATILKKISSLVEPNEVLSVCEIPQHEIKISALKNSFSLVLDSIRDPGNLGTIIRIADWFGIKNIICSEDCVDAYNSKTIQSSMGSIGRVNIAYINIVDLIHDALTEQMPVYAADLNGESITRSTLSKTGLLVIGSESHGLRKDLQQAIKHKLLIPSIGKAESLNAAIATAIICYEFSKIRS